MGMPLAQRRKPAATARIAASPPSMPVLTARIERSENTASICAVMTGAGTRWVAVTPSVFCAVMAVTAVAA